MNVADTLEALRNKAMRDPALKKALIETRNHPNSLGEFCRISTEAGLPIYDMDIIEYGEFAYASMRRSTNGGGENSPLLDGEDDTYEIFLYELEQSENAWNDMPELTPEKKSAKEVFFCYGKGLLFAI